MMPLIRTCLTLGLLLFLSACGSHATIDKDLNIVINSGSGTDTSLPVPSNIKALVDVTSVGFEWASIPNSLAIKGYILYRQNGDDARWHKVGKIMQAHATHFYDAGLKPMTSYTYALSTIGVNDALSPKSAPISIKTSFLNPVENLYVVNGLARKAKIIWSPQANPSIVSYKIERKSNKDARFKTVGKVKNRLYVEFFDDDLKDGERYSYRVIAINYDGIESLPSKEITAVTKNPPLPISNLRASNDRAKMIALAWDKSPTADVKRYNIYQAKSPNGRYKYIGTSLDTSYIARVDEDNAKRYYKVTPFDVDGIEGRLGSEYAMGATIDPPATPRITKASIEDNQAIIIWSKVNDARIKGYIVYRKEGNVIGTTTRYVGITSNNFVDKDIKPGTKYRYTVVSVDRDNIESKPSQEVVLSMDKGA